MHAPTPNRLLTFYGLKWNPFSCDLPVDGLWLTPRVERLAWRIEQLVQEGGFALITGDCGTGKSIALRLLDHKLSRLREVLVGVIVRPQSGVSDFYRELGELFGLKLTPHNRWGGFKALRERWRAHLETTLLRPVLLIDEAQAMTPAVLAELRLLASAQFDTACYLTVVLCGDRRLTEVLRHEDLVALTSRIRTRLVMDHAAPDHLTTLLKHVIDAAGNPALMTDGLIRTLVEHAAGNCRLLMTMAGELLLEALAAEQPQLDEDLYLKVFEPSINAGGASGDTRNNAKSKRRARAEGARI